MNAMLSNYEMEYEKTPLKKLHLKRKGSRVSPEEKQRRKAILARRKAERLRAKRKIKR